MSVEAMEETHANTNSIYDNTNKTLNQGERIFPTWDTPTHGRVVQPFSMGTNNSISSVSINMSRVNSPKGSVAISIWNGDENGTLSEQVAELGVVDFSELEDVGLLPSTLPKLTLNTPIDGLTPHGTYYIVLDERNEASLSDSNTFLKGALLSNEGTNGSGELLLSNPLPLKNDMKFDLASSQNIFGQKRYLQMSIEGTFVELGDFSSNGVLDAVDIDMLSSQFRRVPDDRLFDLNNDATLTQEDRTAWVHDLANTFFGDSNLDGEFNSSDMTFVFQANEYEDNITLNSTWADGDWNGDGDFDSGDLVAAFKDGGYEKGPRAAVNAVPEPSSVILLAIGMIGLCRLHNSRSS
jgi:hypothetical protein